MKKKMLKSSGWLGGGRDKVFIHVQKLKDVQAFEVCNAAPWMLSACNRKPPVLTSWLRDAKQK